MKIRRIHILCPKPEICSLIRKSLPTSKYSVTCTATEDLNEENIDKIDTENLDCLILDDEINNKISEELSERLSKLSVVYLPSFESDMHKDKVVKYMSEPFRLSELNEAIESIFKFK